jgi:hypothetical protein
MSDCTATHATRVVSEVRSSTRILPVIIMGCNQSTERKDATAPVQAAEQAPASAPQEIVAAQEEVAVAPAPAAESEAPQTDVAPATDLQEVTIAPAVVEQTTATSAPTEASTPAQPCYAEEPAAAAQTPAAQPIAAQEEMRSPLAALPALKLPARRDSITKRAKTPSRAKTPTPRGQQKENAVAAKNKTPSKSTTGRGLSVATPNKNTVAVAPVPESKKVYFDPMPAQESKAEKTKKSAKKSAGKHGCNVNEELFLASIAAFERQLTHRNSLNSQLNSR